MPRTTMTWRSYTRKGPALAADTGQPPPPAKKKGHHSGAPSPLRNTYLAECVSVQVRERARGSLCGRVRFRSHAAHTLDFTDTLTHLLSHCQSMGAGRGRGPSSTPNPPAPPHARLCTYPPPGSTQAVHSVEEALQAASQPALSKMGVWCTPSPLEHESWNCPWMGVPKGGSGGCRWFPLALVAVVRVVAGHDVC
jgi:hypothetical protein